MFAAKSDCLPLGVGLCTACAVGQVLVEHRDIRAMTMFRHRIRTARLLLCSWRDEDIQPFTEMVLVPQFSEFLLPVSGAAAAREWVVKKRARFDEHGFGPWVVEAAQTAEFIGCIGLSVVSYEAAFTPAIEISWRVAIQHRGRGYAAEAAEATLADGFARLGLKAIVANTALLNRASRRVMERIGMRYAFEFDHPLWSCPR